MEVNNLNIIQLIEKNPITRLSTKEYTNKFINKIKNNFTETQQQLFSSSFYCYLNYNSKKDFIIDFDTIWKWVGFSRKDSAKKILDKHFTINIDYEVIKPAPQVGGAGFNLNKESKNMGGLGMNKEQIMLAVNTFKKICLKANTKKADEIHDYYIKLEELLHETVEEENNELKTQMELQNYKLKKQNEKLCKNIKQRLKKLEDNKNDNKNVGKKQCNRCNELLYYKSYFLLDKNNDINMYSNECISCYNQENGESKQCYTCKQIKKIIHFNKSSCNNDGLSGNCKECCKQKREKIKESKKEFIDKNIGKKECKFCKEYLIF